MPITIKNSAGGGVTLDSSTSSNETINLNTPVFTGNVGIGVTPEAWSGTVYALQLGEDTALYNDSGYTILANNAYLSGGNKYLSTGAASRHYQVSGTHKFEVAPSGSADAAISFTTAMTIGNDGNVLVGTTSTPNGTSVYGSGFITSNFARKQLHMATNSTNNLFHIRFYNPNGSVGDIRTNGSSTAYNTSSDYRLKENVTPMSGATAAVKLLKPCNFDWIAGGNVNGFLAHELAEVVPEAVSGTKDAMMDEEYEVTPAVVDDEGNETTAAVMGTRSVPDMQGIDQAKLVPLLTATIQELIARIEALENV